MATFIANIGLIQDQTSNSNIDASVNIPQPVQQVVECSQDCQCNKHLDTHQETAQISYRHLESAVRGWMTDGCPEDGRFTQQEQDIILSCFALSNLLRRGEPLRTLGLKYNSACHAECPCQQELTTT